MRLQFPCLGNADWELVTGKRQLIQEFAMLKRAHEWGFVLAGLPYDVNPSNFTRTPLYLGYWFEKHKAAELGR
jgi:hypothetical protein